MFCEPPIINYTASECLLFELTAFCAYTLLCRLQSVRYCAACSLCATALPAVCAHTLLRCLQSVHIHYFAACSLCTFATVLHAVCAHITV
jgi:hypothetical protein